MRRRVTPLLVLSLLLAMVAGACAEVAPREVVIGLTEPAMHTATAGPHIVGAKRKRKVKRKVAARRTPTKRAPAKSSKSSKPSKPSSRRRSKGGKAPNGRPYSPPAPFETSTPVPSDLVFVLVAGSDARPKESFKRTNSDAMHLLAFNPRTLEGTILGFPRDTLVDIPGYGSGKLNSALLRGGTKAMVATIRKLTGLPIHYYVLTSFPGLMKMVDSLGGVNINIPGGMNDRYSAARFKPGWHRLSGKGALAYVRNRHQFQQGDFTRSENQGRLLLAALSKLRVETSDDAGLRRWIGVLVKNTDLDSPPDKLLPLAVLARRIDPARVRNIVVPGTIGFSGKASVVRLTSEAKRIFEDLRADAVIGQPSQPPTSAKPTTTTTTTTTTAPPIPTSTTSTTAAPTTTSSTTTTAAPVTTTTLKLP